MNRNIYSPAAGIERRLQTRASTGFPSTELAASDPEELERAAIDPKEYPNAMPNGKSLYQCHALADEAGPNRA